MTEDKQKILDALLPALRLTRGASDLINLIDVKVKGPEDQEYVLAVFQNGAERKINVTLDSGIAMIRDVCERVV